MRLEAQVDKVSSKEWNESISNRVAELAGQKLGHIVGNPCSLDLEVPAPNSLEVLFQFWRRLEQLDNVGLRVADGLPETRQVHHS